MYSARASAEGPPRFFWPPSFLASVIGACTTLALSSARFLVWFLPHFGFAFICVHHCSSVDSNWFSPPSPFLSRLKSNLESLKMILATFPHTLCLTLQPPTWLIGSSNFRFC